MARPLLLLCLLLGSLGCASRVREPTLTGEARPGGIVRVVVDSNRARDDVVLAGLSEPPLKPTGAVAGDACREFGFRQDWTFPGPSRLTVSELLRSWHRDLLDRGSAGRWLLAPVAGVESYVAGDGSRVVGLEDLGATLRVCVDRPTPDLEERLVHPDLWPLRNRDGFRYGPGPFGPESDEGLPRNSDYAGPPPWLDGVELVSADGNDPMVWLRLGEADVAVVYGSAVTALLGDEESAFDIERSTRLDRDYFLWIHGERRWVNDPTFRAWLAAAVDRNELLAVVLGGHGDAIYSIVDAPGAPAWPQVSRPPLSAESRPRLALRFDETDSHARAIASRIKAVLAQHRVTIRLIPESPDLLVVPPPEYSDVSLTLHGHRAFSDDPVLGLEQAFRAIGRGTEQALEVLDDASRNAEHSLRFEGARLAEHTAAVEARFVPLVRVHGYLVTAPGLQGVEVGIGGVLRFAEAWWSR